MMETPGLSTRSHCFLLAACSEADLQQARLAIASLRAFGGELSDDPVWIFLKEELLRGNPFFEGDTLCLPLPEEDTIQAYPAGGKVAACAAAEELADGKVDSLTWLNPDCLILKPPILFHLPPDWDAALRPVHIRNVGSPAAEPLDGYWGGIYRQIGIDRHSYTVESFVDRQILRPYFNTHCFSFTPAQKISREWREAFRNMIQNSEFQLNWCRESPRQIFLHQAILSALVMKNLLRERVLILPSDYNYPLHLQHRIPTHLRIENLDQITCAVYEDATQLRNITIRSPLTSWLAAHGIRIQG